MESKQTAPAEQISDALRYGIKVIASRIFNKQLAKSGHIFMIAKFHTKKSKVEEGYQVSFDSIKEHGQDALEKTVVDKIVVKYFTKANG